MLGRVTPQYTKSDFLYNVNKSSEQLQKTQTQLNSQRKINLPSDDPVNMINYMKWESQSQDLTRYNQIISAYKDKMNIIDGNLESVTSNLHRARELTVQAANGVYTKEERVAIAMEIDQITRQLVADANTEHKGVSIFGGTSGVSQPYRLEQNMNEQLNNMEVTKVNYFGNAQERIMDIGKNDRITSVLPGPSVFETTVTILQGNRDVAGYVASQDSTMMIDGQEVAIFTGDNIETIAQKINSFELTVKASIETNAQGESVFRLSSVSERQPWLQDVNGSSVLQELGLINEGINAPNNYSTEAIVQKQSIFDTLIKLKQDLLSDNVLAIGGEDLAYIDQSLNNVVRYRTYTGAVTERLEKTYERNETEKLYVNNSSANVIGTNATESITELKMAEFAHQVALNIGAKIMPTTLMDFLR